MTIDSASRPSPRVCAARVSAWIAAVVLIGGTFILPLKWASFSSVRQTVSALAANGAPSQTAMNAVFVVTIIAISVVAILLTEATAFARGLLITAAVSAILVMVFPLPKPDVDTPLHTLFVTVLAFALGFWPATSHVARSHSWPVPSRTTGIVTIVLVALGVNFWLNWLFKTPHTGIYERIFVCSELVALVWFVHMGTRNVRPAKNVVASEVVMASGR